MKQRKFLLLALICTLVLAVGLISACEQINGIIDTVTNGISDVTDSLFGKSVSAVKVDGSELGTLTAGETLDLAKLKISAEYSDGSSQALTLADVKLVVNGIEKDVTSIKLTEGELKLKVGYEVKGKMMWSDELVLTVVAAPHVHSLVKTEAKQPTCTEKGNSAYWTCSGCHKFFADAQGNNEIPVEGQWEIAPLGHDTKKVSAKPATCEQEGNVEYWACERCHKNFADQQGKNELQSVVAPILGHKLKKVDGQPASCTADGWKDYYSCEHEGCTKLFSDEQGEHEIADLAAWKLADGKIAMGQHSGEAISLAPSCEVAGHKAYFQCGGCQDYFEVETGEKIADLDAWKLGAGKVAELGHSYGEWQQTTAPLCTVDGEETRLCTREGCTKSETRPVDELGHSFKWILNTESNEYEYKCEREGCTEFGDKDAMSKALASQKILLTDEGAALELPESATSAMVGTVSVLENLDALKADRKLHGEQTVIVKKVFDGQELEFTKEVLFVTAEISTFNQFWENIHHNKGMANSGGYFEQTADILIEAHYGTTTDRYIRAGEVPSNTSEGCFTGTYDGQGHSITYKVGTYVYQNAGLFGGLSGATIKNVNVTLGTISNWAVGFASRVTNCTLENIKVSATNCANSTSCDAWMFVYCTAGANVYRNIVLDVTGAEMQARDFVVDHFRATEKFENYYIVGADFEKITMDGNELPEGVTLIDKANAEVKVESNSIALGLEGYTLVSAKIGTKALEGCAIEGSNLVVPGASLAGVEGGQILTLTLSKDDKEEVKSFGLYVATKVIKSAQDLTLVAYAGGDNITGLFVLEDDLDLQGATLSSTGNKWDGGFVGTFAGNGHKISNATFGNGGMFGAIGGGARVIHFTLDQASYSDADGTCAMGAIYNNSCIANVVINVKRATANTNTGLISYNASAGYPNKLQITVNAQNLYVGCLVGKEYQTGHYDNASTNVVLNVGGYNVIGKGTKGSAVIEFTKDLMPKKTTINIVDDHTTLGWVYNSAKFGYEWKCLCCGADAPETKPIMYKVVAKNSLIDLTNPETLSSLLPAGTKSAKFNNIELIKDGVVDFTEINKKENHSKHGIGHIFIVATVDGQDLEFQIETATVATKLISTWEEFNTYVRATREGCPTEADKEKGYFVQTADIVIPEGTQLGDQQGKWEAQPKGNYGVFGGRYDGQNHKIDGTGGFWGNSGIFGSTHAAEIKNVNIEYKANAYTVGFDSFFAYTKVENVTIKVTAISTDKDLWVFGYTENNGNTIKNVTIDVSAVSLGAKQRIANELFGTANNSTYENVVIKAKSIVEINAKGTTVATLPTGVTLACQHDIAWRLNESTGKYEYGCPYCGKDSDKYAPVEKAQKVDFSNEEATLAIPQSATSVKVGDMELLKSGAIDLSELKADSTKHGQQSVTVVANGQSLTFDVLFITKVIRTVDDIKALAWNGQYDHSSDVIGYFILEDDIDCQGAKLSSFLSNNGTAGFENWTAGWGFMGTFDGQGHKISNFSVGQAGIFGMINSRKVGNVTFITTIQNVIFDNVTYTNDYRTALLAGAINNSTTFQNITINIAKTATDDNTGILSSNKIGAYTVWNDITINAPDMTIANLLGNNADWNYQGKVDKFLTVNAGAIANWGNALAGGTHNGITFNVVINMDNFNKRVSALPAEEDASARDWFEAKAIKETYDKLSEEDKALVTDSAKLIALATSTRFYEALNITARNAYQGGGGADTGKGSPKSNVNDAMFGACRAFEVTQAGILTFYIEGGHIASESYEEGDAFEFYIFNGGETAIDLGSIVMKETPGYSIAINTGNLSGTIEAKTWGKVTISASGAKNLVKESAQKMYFNIECPTGMFYVSNFYGVKPIAE